MRVTEAFNTKFELLSNSESGNIWNVRAISATTTLNNREYTREELQLGARSLAFRPLNINHDHAQTLPYPENQTLEMNYDINSDAVIGKIQVVDPTINQLIQTGKINKLSIEQIATEGESCSKDVCVQKGVTFTALALLTSDVQAGDPSTSISKAESLQVEVKFIEPEKKESVKEECSCKNSSDNTEFQQSKIFTIYQCYKQPSKVWVSTDRDTKSRSTRRCKRHTT